MLRAFLEKKEEEGKRFAFIALSEIP